MSDHGATSTWWRFDPERRERIANTLRAMLRAKKRDESEAEHIIGELEHSVSFYAPQPGTGMPAKRDWPLPAKVGEAAYALLEALNEGLTGCDTETLRVRLEVLRHVVGGWYAREELSRRRVFRSKWIEALEKLAETPRERHRPRNETRWALEDAVLRDLRRARLTWKDGTLAARVLVEVLEHAFERPKPATDEAQRQVLRRTVDRRPERAQELRCARERRRKTRTRLLIE